MVRIVSQNFSPPRSRHSSGETDLDLAERTKLALSVGRKRVETPEWESSSDSFWDSEFDCDQLEPQLSDGESEIADINGNDPSEKSDPQSKRKQRRRERNKISAQAYRQRRRRQNVKEKQQLMTLELENKRLHRMVETLERKTEQAKQYLRGMQVPMPDILSPVGEDPSEGLEQLSSTEGAANIPTPTNLNDSPSTQFETPTPSISNSPTPPFHNLNISQSSAEQNAQKEGMLHHQAKQSMSQDQPATPITAPSLQPQILINTQGLLASPLPGNENLNGATAVPTYVAVPIEHAAASQCFPPSNLNSMSNLNQGFTPASAGTREGSQQAWMGQTAVIGATAAPVQGSAWNAGKTSATAALPGNAVFSIIKMEMCNNGNIITSNKNENVSNMNLFGQNDSNGNQNNFNTMTMKAINQQHVVAFKINLNQAR